MRARIYFVGCFVGAQKINMTTNPDLPEDIVASEYTNLQLVATITGSPIACHYAKDGRTSLFYESNGCSPNNSNAEYSSHCEENDDTIKFTYTILPPVLDDINYEVVCSFPKQFWKAISIQVKGADDLEVT